MPKKLTLQEKVNTENRLSRFRQRKGLPCPSWSVPNADYRSAKRKRNTPRIDTDLPLAVVAKASLGRKHRSWLFILLPILPFSGAEISR